MRHSVIDQPFLLAQATAPAAATTGTTAPAGPAAPGAPQPPGLLESVLPMVLIFAAFWFLLIAPQRKRQKELEKTLGELKPGDSIVTSSGIFGRIESIRDDRFVVKISDNGTKVELLKSHVQGRSEPKADAKAAS